MDILEYYQNQNVKDRIFEFMGGAEHIVGYGEYEILKKKPKAYYSAAMSDLNSMMAKGLDILRSMLGNYGTMISLDIEYYNPKNPAEVYLNPEEIFKNRLQPVREIIKNIYNNYGIPYIEVITGQGYHYHSMWPFGNEHWQLEKIGHLESSLEKQYINRETKLGHKAVPVYKGYGFSGAFRLLQFITLEIISEADKKRKNNKNILPIQYCDIEMSPPEGVSLDLTIYSDPVHMRAIRVPFGTNQKHKVNKKKLGEQVALNIPMQINLPTTDLSIDTILKMRRDFQMALEYAKDSKTSCIIPDAHISWLNVLSKYKSSRLYEFHKNFDSKDFNKEIYNAINLSELPPCVQFSIANPEPHIKKPTNIKTIVAIFSKKGWSYKDIAGFLFNKFKHLEEFVSNKYNAETRASFFAQLYGAPLYLELDTKIDLDCEYYQKIGYCMRSWCGYNLSWWR
ncbi:MAG: hypothetical protein A2539_05895 [Elusimicrobia bacterium RIFOXYD2_FULL_34_15]|nr:MAG: hypothetical protein A2539_05895 [Elusimicrobia bacterium RIFOXYD2_FULL_34_15]